MVKITQTFSGIERENKFSAPPFLSMAAKIIAFSSGDTIYKGLFLFRQANTEVLKVRQSCLGRRKIFPHAAPPKALFPDLDLQEVRGEGPLGKR